MYNNDRHALLVKRINKIVQRNPKFQSRSDRLEEAGIIYPFLKGPHRALTFPPICHIPASDPYKDRDNGHQK